MKRLIVLSGAVLLSAASAQAGGLSPGLEETLRQTAPEEVVSTLVFMAAQADLELIDMRMDAQRASIKQRHETVVRALQQTARDFQADLLNHLDTLQAQDRISDYEAFWVANIVRVDATPAEIRALAWRADVDVVYPNYPIELIEPTSSRRDVRPLGPREPEIGLQAIRAPEVWAMGITGEGVLVSTLDTGVDGSHPALASRWRGLDPAYEGHPEWAFFDPVTNWQFPQDSGTHGTHTMGTVCGGPPGDEIGVAPGAEWIHAAVIDRVSIEQTVADAILAFQWLIDPDGDPGTHWDVPVVCSNSWGLTTGHGYPPCDETFWPYLDACETAGITILFSAGNEGSSGLRRPADRATDDYRTCAVAAVDANNPSWPIAGFSSRGPTYCTPDGTAAIKPDIAAPGVDVRSSVPGGGYGLKSGTSMASPHVNGVVALMKQACPQLMPEQIKQIIYDTAYDLGDPGEDNDYGWGMIDAYQAVLMAIAMCGPTPPLSYDGYWETPAGTPVEIELNAFDPDGEPGPLSYIIVTLPEHGVLSDPGAGDIADVPYTLVDNGNVVVYDPNPVYQGPDSFTFKANDGGEPPDGGDSEIATIYITVGVPEPVHVFNMDEDPGWTMAGQWEWGHPTGQGGNSHGYPDPDSGATGDNVCGVNLNGDYNTSSGGPYYLTTTAIDCTETTEIELHFKRWLNSDFDPFVINTVEASNDGVNWEELWSNGPNEIAEHAWSDHVFDISEIADNQPTVYIRWGYEVNVGAWAYSGWNLDDVEIWGVVLIGDCPEDINGDGVVDTEDLLILLGNWGTDGDGDIDNNGVVETADLLALLAAWGECP
jgi:bacillopeptidase F